MFPSGARTESEDKLTRFTKFLRRNTACLAQVASSPIKAMGNVPASIVKKAKRTRELEKYAKPTGLYDTCPWDLRTVRKWVLNGTLAPMYEGVETPTDTTEECPICFMHYEAVNRSSCCKKAMCTECYLQIKPPRQAPDCPFCNGAKFSVAYTGGLTEAEREVLRQEEQRIIEAQIRARQDQEKEDAERRRRRLAEEEEAEEEKRAAAPAWPWSRRQDGGDSGEGVLATLPAASAGDDGDAFDGAGFPVFDHRDQMEAALLDLLPDVQASGLSSQDGTGPAQTDNFFYNPHIEHPQESATVVANNDDHSSNDGLDDPVAASLFDSMNESMSQTLSLARFDETSTDNNRQQSESNSAQGVFGQLPNSEGILSSSEERSSWGDFQVAEGAQRPPSATSNRIQEGSSTPVLQAAGTSLIEQNEGKEEPRELPPPAVGDLVSISVDAIVDVSVDNALLLDSPPFENNNAEITTPQQEFIQQQSEEEKDCLEGPAKEDDPTPSPLATSASNVNESGFVGGIIDRRTIKTVISTTGNDSMDCDEETGRRYVAALSKITSGDEVSIRREEQEGVAEDEEEAKYPPSAGLPSLLPPPPPPSSLLLLSTDEEEHRRG